MNNPRRTSTSMSVYKSKWGEKLKKNKQNKNQRQNKGNMKTKKETKKV